MMQKTFTLLPLLMSSAFFGQTTNELKSEIDKLKSDLIILNTEIESVKSQNLYLKEKLNLNRPVLKQEHDQVTFNITSIIGNKKLKTVTISILLEATDQNKNILLDGFSAIDLEGNAYGVEKHKPVSGFTGRSVMLTKMVPAKVIPILTAVPETVKILKMLKMHYFSADSRKHADIEFRDVNVIWE